MGQHQKQEELWVEPIEVMRRIPADNPLRKINRILELGFAREEVAKFYGKKGNESVDPVIILKLMLLLFLDNVPSERELMRIIPLRLDYLWFLGYSLEEEIPNHSVLSKARKRWGEEVFRRLFARTVEQCVQAGLVEGSKLHVDASLIRANASLNSIVKVAVDGQMKKLDETEEDDPPNKPGPVNDSHRSTTDGDSSLVRHDGGKSVPSYKNHRVVDDKAGVITAVATTTGAINEAEALVELVEEHEWRLGRPAQVVVADSKYGNSSNFIALAAKGVRTHMGDLRAKLNNYRLKDIYPAERFKYDAKTDTFRCPANRRLTRHHYHHQRGYYEYRTAPGVCSSCRLRSRCTKAKAGRTLNRYEHQNLLDRARRQSQSPAAHRDRQRRQHLQEGNFADAANHHGFKRSRWRGLWKQSIQDLLIAACQNLRKLAQTLLSRFFLLMTRLSDCLDSIGTRYRLAKLSNQYFIQCSTCA